MKKVVWGDSFAPGDSPGCRMNSFSRHWASGLNTGMHFLSGLDKCIPSLETDMGPQSGRDDYTISPGITRRGYKSRQERE